MTFLKNISWIFLAEIITKTVGLISTFYLARILEPDGFGIYNYAMVIVGYCYLVVNLGFNDYGILKIAANPNSNNISIISSTIVIARLILASISLIIIYILSTTLEILLDKKYIILSLGFMAITNAINLEWLFTAIQKLKLVAIPRIISSLCFFLMLFILVKDKSDITEAAIVTTIRYLILAIPFYFFFWTSYRFTRPSAATFRSLLQGILPLGFVSLTAQLNTSADIVLLGYFTNEVEIGYYAAVIRLIGLGINFKMVIAQGLYPKIVNSLNTSTINFQIIATRTTKYSLIIGILMGLILFFQSQNIILLLYGKAFSSSITAFKIALWLLVLEIGGIVFPYAVLSHSQKEYAKRIGLTALINVGLNFIFIPIYGITGAAIVYLLSTIYLIVSCYHYIYQNIITLTISAIIWQPIIAGIIAAITMFVCSKIHDILGLIIGVGIYFVALLFMGIKPKDVYLEITGKHR